MRILIVEDDRLNRLNLQRQLSVNHSVLTAQSYEEAKEILEQYIVELVFLDLQLDESTKEPTGLKVLKDLRQMSSSAVVVVMTGLEESKLIEKAFELGATDYIFKPIEASKLELMIQKAKIVQRLIRQNQSLKARVGNSIQKIVLRTKSPKFQEVLDKAKKLKGKNVSVLIRGETGVGKDILAQYLWSVEEQDCRPFIPVNCAAITPTLAESELFGHRKGAFSGATENRVGKFEDADSGDIFLDEVATLSMDVQQKLLRVLNDGEIVPVGCNAARKVSCRIIAATNENVEEMVKEKIFREDLLYRLQQVTLTVPPLRERPEDISDLIKLFLMNGGHHGKKLSKEASDFCSSYRWPGNVRELKSAIETAAIFTEGDLISLEILKSNIFSIDTKATESCAKAIETLSATDVRGNFNGLVCQFERNLIDFAIEKEGSETAAAKFLGIPRTTLRSIRNTHEKN